VIKAKYTQTLDEIISSGYELKSLALYPIFDERYRTVLNEKIKMYYQFYEISSETIEIFDNRLYAKLLDVMKYYNQFYEIEKLKNEIGFKELLNKRYQDYTNNVGNLNGTTTVDGNLKHLGKDTNILLGNTLRTPNLTTTTDIDYNNTVKTHNNNTNTFTNMGGKDITESATLNADTPQNNSPITNATGSNSFNDFNNDVFKINGYLTSADKNLIVSELRSTNKNELDGWTTNGKTGNDTHTTTEQGTENIEQHSTTTLSYDSSNKTDSQTTQLQDTTNDTTKYGNQDYIKSLQDLIDNLNNVDTLVCKELRELFLYVY
jgi:hypothetical protein